jgi:hypothetical protein
VASAGKAVGAQAPGLTFFVSPQYQQVSAVLALLAASFILPFNAMNVSRFSLFLFLSVLATSLTGCEAIGTIFKAGAYTGIIAVVVILALVWFIISKMRGPRV